MGKCTDASSGSDREGRSTGARGPALPTGGSHHCPATEPMARRNLAKKAVSSPTVWSEGCWSPRSRRRFQAESVLAPRAISWRGRLPDPEEVTMNAHKRRTAVLAISSILLGAASYAATIGPGQAEQQVTDDATILISTITVGHDARKTHRDRERASGSTDGQKSAEAGLDAAADERRPRGQAVARSTEGSELDVVLRSLPGRDSRTSDCS